MIVSSTGRTWKLHSTILGNYSTVLRDLMDGIEAHRSIKRRKDEVKSVRWTILMVPWNKKVADDRLRRFKIIVSTFLIMSPRSETHLLENFKG